jgi:hypothetical protein
MARLPHDLLHALLPAPLDEGTNRPEVARCSESEVRWVKYAASRVNRPFRITDLESLVPLENMTARRFDASSQSRRQRE